MAMTVATKQYLWLNLRGIKEKMVLLDASHSGLFGTDLSTVVQRFREARVQSVAFKKFILCHGFFSSCKPFLTMRNLRETNIMSVHFTRLDWITISISLSYLSTPPGKMEAMQFFLGVGKQFKVYESVNMLPGGMGILIERERKHCHYLHPTSSSFIICHYLHPTSSFFIIFFPAL